jgi:tRNA(Ile)-lysidine synthase
MPVEQSLEQRFADAVAAFGEIPTPAILAVSGGGDSTALMYLAAQVVQREALTVVSVNHGLRAEAAEEIAQVAAQAGTLGLTHYTEDWVWSGQGNLQAAARDGRWACLRRVAAEQGARWVWTGHTEDDQVETALMRLARGSGIDGLAGMSRQSVRDGLMIGRPLLGMTRDDLRHWLAENCIDWSEDPSNEDPGFDRIRARQMLPQLAALGLTRKRLLQTVDHMQAARVSLQLAAQTFARDHVRQTAGDLLLSPAVLDFSVADVPRRVFAAALGWVAGHTYRPRFAQLRKAANDAQLGRRVTLGGVLILPEADGSVRLTREAAATDEMILTGAKEAMVWDGRWHIAGPFLPDMTVRALGDAVQDCPDWRATRMPRTTLLATPSVWRNGSLIAAPVAGLADGWSARIVADFHSDAFPIED